MLDNERRGLFNEWQALFHKIRSLSGILQNSGTLSEQQIKEWRDLAFINWNALRELTGETLNYLRIKT